MLTCNRIDRQGGGVALYINNNLHFDQLKNLESNDDNVCQSILIEVKFGKSSKVIGVIYRPPRSVLNKFNDYIDKTLSILKNSNKSVHIMGDFNINLLNIDSCNLTRDFFETMLSYSLCSSIFRPTRITSHSATLIDNIFSNNFSLPFSSGILLTDISDHLPIFSILETNLPHTKAVPYYYKRNNSRDNLHRFVDSLKLFNWTPILNTTDPNSAYALFQDNLNTLYNQHVPIVKVKTHKHQARKPWLTQGLIKSIRVKNKLYKTFLRNIGQQTQKPNTKHFAIN